MRVASRHGYACADGCSEYMYCDIYNEYADGDDDDGGFDMFDDVCVVCGKYDDYAEYAYYVNPSTAACYCDDDGCYVNSVAY